MDRGLLPELLTPWLGRVLVVSTLLGSLGACVADVRQPESPPPTPVVSGPMASSSPEAMSSRDAFAVGPESDAGEAAAALADGGQPWRSLAVDVAVRFAKQVLGWRPIARSEAESAYAATYRVWDRRDRRRAIEVTMVQRSSPFWSVGSLRGVGSFADVTPGVSVRLDEWRSSSTARRASRRADRRARSVRIASRPRGRRHRRDGDLPPRRPDERRGLLADPVAGWRRERGLCVRQRISGGDDRGRLMLRG
jgi:hypothetical protein